MRKILTIITMLLVIASIFGQQRSSGRGSRRRRSPSSVMQTDPNSLKKDVSAEKRDKTLEERVEELESRVDELERVNSNLLQNHILLEMHLEDLRSEVIDYKVVKKKEERRKRNMTEEEKDIASGIYPLLPRLKYEGVW